MLHRLMIRAIPVALAAGLVTACGSAAMSPPDDGRAVGILAEWQKEDGETRPSKVAKDGAMAPTPQAASELFDAVDADLDAEIKRRAPAEKASKERLRREQLGDWAPKAGGWGD